MQGRTDEPLNDTGRQQAREAREKIRNIHFDAVYASPLDRAIETATIIGDVNRRDVIIDERIIEVNFGKYELKKYSALGPAMTLYWLLPTLLPTPGTVESLDSMRQRSRSFLQELEQKNYDNVLVACHGGIMRALCGYLMDKRNGVMWYPKPHNCEIRVFESVNGRHRLLERIR